MFVWEQDGEGYDSNFKAHRQLVKCITFNLDVICTQSATLMFSNQHLNILS